MKILLAVDGTKFGDAAVDMTGQIAVGTGDQIRIISVVDVSLPLAIDLSGAYVPETSEIEKASRENAHLIVDRSKEKLREMFATMDVAISGDILFGSPESRIVETAEEMGADLIILGSHGYKRWERLLLGSVSGSVVHHAPCSVLVVRLRENK